MKQIVFQNVCKKASEVGRPKKEPDSKDAEAGAVMLAWYAKAVEQFPEGLVSQAQAAVMLGVSRVAVSRLVTRGELRAVYFPEFENDPENPAYVGIAVGQDDPMWLKLIASISDFDKTYAFPKIALVSFADVMRLWQNGDAKEKCRRDVREILAAIGRDSHKRLAAIQRQKKKQARNDAGKSG